jgi:hypothetical protein
MRATVSLPTVRPGGRRRTPHRRPPTGRPWTLVHFSHFSRIEFAGVTADSYSVAGASLSPTVL